MFSFFENPLTIYHHHRNNNNNKHIQIDDTCKEFPGAVFRSSCTHSFKQPFGSYSRSKLAQATAVKAIGHAFLSLHSYHHYHNDHCHYHAIAIIIIMNIIIGFLSSTHHHLFSFLSEFSHHHHHYIISENFLIIIIIINSIFLNYYHNLVLSSLLSQFSRFFSIIIIIFSDKYYYQYFFSVYFPYLHLSFLIFLNYRPFPVIITFLSVPFPLKREKFPRNCSLFLISGDIFWKKG